MTTGGAVDTRLNCENGARLTAPSALAELISGLKGRVAVGCFASNVARMDTVIRAAEDAGARVLAGQVRGRLVVDVNR
mgnify:CR=1 FL=1